MKVKSLLELNTLRSINNGNLDNDINGMFVCDLLSHVMGNASEGNILITVLNNINVLGVASLLDMSCVIFTHNTKVGDDIIQKATELEIPLFVTELSNADIVVKLSTFGVKN